MTLITSSTPPYPSTHPLAHPHSSSPPANDPLDDVFGSPPPSPSRADSQNPSADPTDLPLLRRTHETNGYREGVAASKETHIQAGFDEGHALGGELGLAVGKVLGLLTGLRRAVFAAAAAPSAGRSGGDEVEEKSKQDVEEKLRLAETGLRLERVFGPEFFAEDGIWRFDVPTSSMNATAAGQVVSAQVVSVERGGGTSGEAEGEDITFAQVAAAHPLVRKWEAIATQLAETIGLDLPR